MKEELFLARLQQGQALVEALVLAAALIPLLLAVPLIAKYQDIRHAAIAASRTAAFECSVRPDDCGEGQARATIAADLRRRHFARHDRDLLSADDMSDDAPLSERNRFWVDRRGASLLASASDVELQLDVGSSDAAGRAWLRAGADAGGNLAADAAADAMSALAGPAAFGLDIGYGLSAARVQAGVSLSRTLAQWLQRPEGMRLTLSGKTAVMVDAWNASSGKGTGSRSFESRVEQGRRLPGSGEEAFDLLYAPIRQLITGPLLAPIEPRGNLFRYHEIDVDIVPEDRVGEP
jgi:hypothetical protein